MGEVFILIVRRVNLGARIISLYAGCMIRYTRMGESADQTHNVHEFCGEHTQLFRLSACARNQISCMQPERGYEAQTGNQTEKRIILCTPNTTGETSSEPAPNPPVGGGTRPRCFVLFICFPESRNGGRKTKRV